jgi:hypothetical protein
LGFVKKLRISMRKSGGCDMMSSDALCTT